MTILSRTLEEVPEQLGQSNSEDFAAVQAAQVFLRYGEPELTGDQLVRLARSFGALMPNVLNAAGVRLGASETSERYVRLMNDLGKEIR